MGRKINSILEAGVSRNDHNSWEHLFHFTSHCLRLPQRGAQGPSLATLVNRQIEAEADLPNAKASPRSKGSQYTPKDPIRLLAAQVSTKLEEGNFRGAVQIASSEETLAQSDEAIFAALQDKHPTLHPDSAIPSLQDDFLLHPIPVTAKDIVKAIRSFPNGSDGGPDGLKP